MHGPRLAHGIGAHISRNHECGPGGVYAQGLCTQTAEAKHKHAAHQDTASAPNAYKVVCRRMFAIRSHVATSSIHTVIGWIGARATGEAPTPKSLIGPNSSQMSPNGPAGPKDLRGLLNRGGSHQPFDTDTGVVALLRMTPPNL